MITYNDLYEALRKERYGEQLQPLLKDFVKEVANYLKEREQLIGQEKDNQLCQGRERNSKNS